MKPPATRLWPVTRASLALWRGLAVLACLWAGSVLSAHAAWDVRQVDDRDYVTLESFCKFYGFEYKDPGSAEEFVARNGRHEIRIRHASRIMYIDGYRHWFAFGVIRDPDKERYPEGDGPWLISKTDIIKLLEPIFRPHLIKQRRPIKGVVLDPGHGGSDAGAVNRRGQREKALALEMAFRIQKILREKGVKVVLTRRSDTFIGLSERASRASKYDDYAFVSLHFNAASSSAYGPETFVTTPVGASSSNGGSKVRRSDYQRQVNNNEDARNVLLGHEIQKRLADLYPGDDEADRGLKRARFVVLRKNALPSALVEFGFLSNSTEARRIGSEDYRQKLAQAAADGILAFISQMSPPPTRLTSPGLRGPVIKTEAPEVTAPPIEAPALEEEKLTVPPGTAEDEVDEPDQTPAPAEIIIFGQE